MPIWPGPKVYLTRMPDGPRWYDGQLSTVSNVQENKGTAEASKKGKEGGKEGKEGRQKGRYVECSVEVSICHVDAAPEPKSLAIWLGRRTGANVMTQDQARRIAANIAKLPELVGAEPKSDPNAPFSEKIARRPRCAIKLQLDGIACQLFGDDVRRVVGQHDAAGTDPDVLCPSGDMAKHDRCCGAGDTRWILR
jgi:hypothetical protein